MDKKHTQRGYLKPITSLCVVVVLIIPIIHYQCIIKKNMSKLLKDNNFTHFVSVQLRGGEIKHMDGCVDLGNSGECVEERRGGE